MKTYILGKSRNSFVAQVVDYVEYHKTFKRILLKDVDYEILKSIMLTSIRSYPIILYNFDDFEFFLYNEVDLNIQIIL